MCSNPIIVDKLHFEGLYCALAFVRDTCALAPRLVASLEQAAVWSLPCVGFCLVDEVVDLF